MDARNSPPLEVFVSDLEYTEVDGVARILLNRPQVRNCVNGEIMDRLSERVNELVDRDDLHAVVLSAAGTDAFCAGGDLKWLRRYETGAEGRDMGRHMQKALCTLSALPMPVICVLNGYALGGGAELALACDLRVMESHAFFSFKQVQVGLITGWSGGARLVRTVGYPKAMEWALTGHRVGAEEALALGLANQIVPTGDGMTHALALVDRIRLGSKSAVRAMKTLMRTSENQTFAQAIEVESELFERLWAADDHREAVQAFLEKRKPEF